VRVIEVVQSLGERLLRHVGLELDVNDLTCCHWSARPRNVVLRVSSYVTVMVLGPCTRPGPLSSPMAVLAQVVLAEPGTSLLMILCGWPPRVALHGRFLVHY